MLIEQTLEQLQELRLTGMAAALEEQRGVPDIQSLSFEDRLALLVERERTARDDRRRTRLLRQAKLRIPSATSRPSTSERHAAWIAPLSCASPAATGSATIRSRSSPVPRERERRS